MSIIWIFILIVVVSFFLLKSHARQTPKWQVFPIEGDILIAGISYSENLEKIKQGREGDDMSLIREPDNPYDNNAIEVCDGERKKWGYIPRTFAYFLAPFIDRNEIKVETRIKKNYKTEGDVITVIIHLIVNPLGEEHREMAWQTLKRQLRLHQPRYSELDNELEQHLFLKQLEEQLQMEKAKKNKERIAREKRIEQDYGYDEEFDIKEFDIKAREKMEFERDGLNSRQGLEEFQKKNWKKAIELLEKISVKFPNRLDIQRKIDYAHDQIEPWAPILREIETLNQKAKELKREIDWAFSPQSAMTEDGTSCNLVEKQARLAELQTQIIELINRAKNKYPKAVKEFIHAKRKTKKQQKEWYEKEIYSKKW